MKMSSPDKHGEADEEINGVEKRAEAIHGRLVHKSVIFELQSHESTRQNETLHPGSL